MTSPPAFGELVLRCDVAELLMDDFDPEPHRLSRFLRPALISIRWGCQLGFDPASAAIY